MSEIWIPKFRGVTEDGEVAEGFLQRSPFESDNLIVGDFGAWYRIIPESLAMQTGLKDANGADIYGSLPGTRGGDVVETVESRPSITLGEQGFARWMGYGFYVENVPPWNWDRMSPGFALDCVKVKIIGNAYLNPELLEVRDVEL